MITVVDKNIFHCVSRLSVAKRGFDGRGDFVLLVDEQRYLGTTTYTTNSDAKPTGTATINIELTAGQIVRVENRESTSIFGTSSGGTIQSYFTGYMLYLLE